MTRSTWWCFAAPQLSIIEMEQLAALLDGRRVNAATTLIVATSPENKFAADRMGLTARIEGAGGVVAAGICFYQSYAREMAEANGWQRLLTNSAKSSTSSQATATSPRSPAWSAASTAPAREGSFDAARPEVPHRHWPGRPRNALVADDNFSARYDLDRIKGVFSRPQHKLHGQSYVDKILVLVRRRAAWLGVDAARDERAQACTEAIIFDRTNTILAQGRRLLA